ncbi:tandem-95 repeat protein, partial [Pseudodesulfovibrio sp.]|uniref:tandem-95 repeat protein n=1 Tax=Pseudodesulfovibrio sp. TaxID=2035812 RepID=UPI0026053AFE
GDAPTGLTMNADGTYTFDASSYDTLAAGQTQEITATYTVSDGHEGVAANTLTITVTGTNDAPELTFSAADTTYNYIQNGSFEGVDIDAGGWAQGYNPPNWTLEAGGHFEVMDGQRGGIIGASDGENVLDMAVGTGVPVSVSQTVTGLTEGAYAISIDAFDRGEHLGEADSGAIHILWNGVEIGSINPGSEAWETGAFTVTVADGETSGTLTLTSEDGGTFGNVIDNVAMYAVNTGDAVPVSVAENTAAGAVVATALGADVDGDALAYSLVDNDSPFTIDASTGVITLAGDLNHEEASSYTIQVAVSDGDETTIKNLTIQVADVNEAPVVESPVVLDNMAEDGGPVTFTEAQLLANAYDPDNEGGANPQDGLSVTGLAVTDGSGALVDNGDGTWTFTPSGNWNGDVQLTYSVTDGEHSTAASASFDVTPVNDGPTLEFASAVDAENLIQNGSFEGVDIDAGGWAQGYNPPNWTLEAGGHFEVMDGHRGGIIGASDGENVNDMAVGSGEPVVISQTVTDLAAGQYVIGLDLFDRGSHLNEPDSGNIDVYWNGELVATLNPGDDAWETGSIIVTVADGETSGTLTLASHDPGTFGNVIDNVTMHAIDPVESATVTLAEDAANGAYVATAVGSDVDSTDLTFSIVGDSPFSINPETGVITLTGALDYETATSHTITVAVADGNGGVTTRDLTIDVSNLNDNAPTLAVGPVAGVAENADATVVATLAPADLDGDSVTYTLTATDGAGNDASGLFSMDGDKVVAAAGLDYETAGQYHISVTASDGVHDSNTVEFDVNVDNLNDNAPTLAVGPVADVAENADATVVATLAPADLDGDSVT